MKCNYYVAQEDVFRVFFFFSNKYNLYVYANEHVDDSW